MPFETLPIDGNIRAQSRPHDVPQLQWSHRRTAGAKRVDVVRPAHDPLGEQKAGRQFFVVSRRSHRDRDAPVGTFLPRSVPETDFQRFLNCQCVQLRRGNRLPHRPADGNGHVSLLGDHEVFSRARPHWKVKALAQHAAHAQLTTRSINPASPVLTVGSPPFILITAIAPNNGPPEWSP